jgi:hypothetical protein
LSAVFKGQRVRSKSTALFVSRLYLLNNQSRLGEDFDPNQADSLSGEK